MAHWAEINNENIVIRVIVTDNNDPNNDEGYNWIIENLGGTWLKASYNASINGFRKNFPGSGFYYDKDKDAFISPKPYESWILNEDSCRWNPPVDYPNDGLNYYWSEELRLWVNN